MLKLNIFIPESHLEQVKQAMFDAGAGKIANYDCCCWEVLGTGQFRPLAGSSPFIGNQEQIEFVREYKVEMLCTEGNIIDVIAALKAVHPYEEPAFDVVKIEDYS